MGNILVSGANSFIGRHLIDELLKRDEHVIGLVRSLERIPSDWDKNVRIIQGDIREKDSIGGIGKNIEMVFHLAAKVHDFSGSHGSDEGYFNVNVTGTRNLLEECIDTGIKHFIYFSSVKAMVEDKAYNLDESFTPAPKTPYGKSKLEAERLVAEGGRKYGIKTTSLRLPLVYGPGNKGNIYRLIKAVDKGRFILIGRGENRRSMVHVKNVVDAALAVAGQPEADGKAYIVTDGTDYSIKELFELISRNLGKKPSPFYIPRGISRGLARIGDLGGGLIRRPLPFNSDVLEKLTNIYTFSSHKIQKEIGFKPRYNLDNTLSETIKWYRSLRRER